MSGNARGASREVKQFNRSSCKRTPSHREGLEHHLDFLNLVLLGIDASIGAVIFVTCNAGSAYLYAYTTFDELTAFLVFAQLMLDNHIGAASIARNTRDLETIVWCRAHPNARARSDRDEYRVIGVRLSAATGPPELEVFGDPTEPCLGPHSPPELSITMRRAQNLIFHVYVHFMCVMLFLTGIRCRERRHHCVTVTRDIGDQAKSMLVSHDSWSGLKQRHYCLYYVICCMRVVPSSPKTTRRGGTVVDAMTWGTAGDLTMFVMESHSPRVSISMVMSRNGKVMHELFFITSSSHQRDVGHAHGLSRACTWPFHAMLAPYGR
ncbi:hypothetical protein Sjap_012621 [Stephania japonica]|uniref:Uncharacterized protein n=1 Tax=Stephania japonica TaxID=461633 RepID=A0AAP0IWF0_9MAGN